MERLPPSRKFGWLQVMEEGRLHPSLCEKMMTVALPSGYLFSPPFSPISPVGEVICPECHVESRGTHDTVESLELGEDFLNSCPPYDALDSSAKAPFTPFLKFSHPELTVCSERSCFHCSHIHPRLFSLVFLLSNVRSGAPSLLGLAACFSNATCIVSCHSGVRLRVKWPSLRISGICT